ncbi:glycosyltransferase family 4 protein [Nodosilinea sp. E11]|uniref:glycosyltransferase family 4 protein n=1 Tax=Nodosilinea sp. E11 TaxID=3037479 RepID=UPI0029348056|nr:glycosyltransferase family 4 protein [Nodosilinea sp. E11]WOD40915.1 glycosyltransferase family 4 protein [Nodosilinea sp. E11]
MAAEPLPTAVAVVHEWLASRAGSEKVVEQLLAVYPQADVFSLVEFLAPEAAGLIPPGTRVQTSFIQNLPWARQHFRQYLPLMPLAIEQFDLSAYDLVISSNHAVAKGVLTRPHQLHISYVHTPIRYAWDLQHQYLQQAGLTGGVKSAITRLLLHYLRLWDLAAAHRVDCFVANSRYVARRIWKTYRRPATVIYPPVAIDRFRWQQPRDNFYLTVSRCVPYKRVDLTVEAFNRLGLPLVVIGDGPALGALQQAAKSNISFLRNPSDAVVSDYMERCRGFVFPAEEDFGITVVEAQAAGAPVIAYGRGGCAETVIDGKTGILFHRQTVDHLVQAVQQFEQNRGSFGAETIRNQAETFSEQRFQRELTTYVADKWLKFQQGDELE